MNFPERLLLYEKYFGAKSLYKKFMSGYSTFVCHRCGKEWESLDNSGCPICRNKEMCVVPFKGTIKTYIFEIQYLSHDQSWVRQQVVENEETGRAGLKYLSSLTKTKYRLVKVSTEVIV